ncbi:MAG: nuclear transport factor 2 family protein [Acidobacteriaceae bacterium]
MRALSLLSIALLLVTPPGWGLAQARGRHRQKRLERSQIVAMEHKWQQATLSNNIPAMDSLLSDDYLGITAGGQVLTKTQQLDRMKERRLVITHLSTSETKIKLIGKIAIVTCLAQIQGFSNGRMIDGAYRYTRVYQRLPEGIWKVTNFEITPALQLHPEPTLQ